MSRITPVLAAFAKRVMIGCAVVAYMFTADSLLAVAAVQPTLTCRDVSICHFVMASPWTFGTLGVLMNIMAFCALVTYWDWEDKNLKD